MSSYGSNKDGDDALNVRLADAVRNACVAAALDAYEGASMDGLCHEGAWEVAIGAIRSLDVERIVRQVAGEANAGR